MRILNFSKLLSSLPLIPITSHSGGTPVAWASLRGLNVLLFVVIGVCVVGMIYFFKWYHKHPVGGKIALWVLAVWGIWWLIRYIRALNDDPLLRAAPYREIEIPKEDFSSTKK